MPDQDKDLNLLLSMDLFSPLVDDVEKVVDSNNNASAACANKHPYFRIINDNLTVVYSTSDVEEIELTETLINRWLNPVQHVTEKKTYGIEGL